MEALIPAALILVGIAVGVTVFVLGMTTGVAVYLIARKPAHPPLRRRRRRPAGSSDKLSVAPPVVPASPAPVPAAADPSPQVGPKPLPKEPPPLDDNIGKAIEFHSQAVQHWIRGENEEAYSKMTQAMSVCAQMNNPWLSIEVAMQVRNLACLTRQFDQANMLEHFMEKLRSMLPPGATQTSNYLTEPKIDDMSWMNKTNMTEVQAAEPAWKLHGMANQALLAGNLDDALELATQALDKSVAINGMNHWITGVMLHGVAQLHMLREEFQSAHGFLRKAHMIMGDWLYAAPNLQGAIAHNLAECEKALGQSSDGNDSVPDSNR